ncbi:hypothetical protein NT6N_32040 [Oceaniferula spumae]|uniref:Lipoprotein n=1 Tax=Oceaniferula spumae TaxID=2979115 RepID=A0AAT9FQJ4_9BACT
MGVLIISACDNDEQSEKTNVNDSGNKFSQKYGKSDMVSDCNTLILQLDGGDVDAIVEAVNTFIDKVDRALEKGTLSFVVEGNTRGPSVVNFRYLLKGLKMEVEKLVYRKELIMRGLDPPDSINIEIKTIRQILIEIKKWG